jgi:hypothetical protein
MQRKGLRFPHQPRYISFKVPRKKLPSSFPYRALASTKMLHLQSPLYMSLKVPRKEIPPPGFPYRAHT